MLHIVHYFGLPHRSRTTDHGTFDQFSVTSQGGWDGWSLTGPNGTAPKKRDACVWFVFITSHSWWSRIMTHDSTVRTSVLEPKDNICHKSLTHAHVHSCQILILLIPLFEIFCTIWPCCSLTLTKCVFTDSLTKQNSNGSRLFKWLWEIMNRSHQCWSLLDDSSLELSSSCNSLVFSVRHRFTLSCKLLVMLPPDQ